MHAATTTEGRGAAQKALFGYMLGPSVQGSARHYEQFALSPQVCANLHAHPFRAYRRALGKDEVCMQVWHVRWL